MQGFDKLRQPFIERFRLLPEAFLHLSPDLVNCGPAVHTLPDKAAKIIQLYIAVPGPFEKYLGYLMKQPLVMDTDFYVVLVVGGIFIQGIMLWYIVKIVVVICQCTAPFRVYPTVPGKIFLFLYTAHCL